MHLRDIYTEYEVNKIINHCYKNIKYIYETD